MKEAKVFITQEIYTRGDEGEFRVKFDLSSAAERGQLVFLFGHGPVALMPDAMIEGIVARLIDEEYDPHIDYILNIGDNSIAHALGMVIGRAFGKSRMLRWDRKRREYDVITIDLNKTVNRSLVQRLADFVMGLLQPVAGVK